MSQPPLLAVLPGGRPATGRHAVVPVDLAVRADVPLAALRLYVILASRAQRGDRQCAWARGELLTLTGWTASRVVRRYVADLVAVGAVEVLAVWESGGDWWTRYRLPALWTTDP